MEWPNNADGDVFRRLKSSDFNFSKEYDIDFNIDFDHWPLTVNTISFFQSNYPNLKIIEPNEEEIDSGDINGYIEIQIRHKVEYDFVIKTQSKLTKMSQPFGGWCESWGVMQD